MNFINITKTNPWIICGESHSAIIALWFRALYPELTVGAIATSPILPTLFTPEISYKIYSNYISGGKKIREVILRLLQ